MPFRITYSCTILLLLWGSTASADEDSATTKPVATLPVTRVLSGDGKPVPGAEVAVRRADGFAGLPEWHKTAPDGTVLGPSEGLIIKGKDWYPPQKKYELLARAPGYAPSVTTIELSTSEPEILVRLEKGVEREIHLVPPHGQRLPESLEPFIALEKHLPWAWNQVSADKSDPHGRDIVLFPVKRTGPGRFTFTAAEETSPVYVLVNAPGFLLGFQSDAFGHEALSRGLVTIPLPVPGALEATFGPVPGVRQELLFRRCGMELTTGSVVTGNVWVSASLLQHEDTGASTSKTFSHLAPGTYQLSAFSGTMSTRHDRENSQAYNTSDRVTIDSGRTTTCSLTYDPYDPEKLKGNCSVLVKVREADGIRPAAGVPYSVVYLLPAIGQKELTSGTLSPEGSFSLEGIACGKDAHNPMLEVDGEWLGRIKLNTEGTSRTVEFKRPVKAGMMAPDIELLDPQTSQVVKLSDLRGKVVLLDFWATWCGPCQEPMAHNSELLKKHGPAWRDNVVIIGASIDDDPEVLMKHVRKNGWSNVRQLWCHQGVPGFKADAPRAYTISGVPTALVIDAHGRITWRGHPGPGVESEIEKALSAGGGRRN